MGPRAPHGVRVWVIFTNWNGLQRGTLILFALFFFFWKIVLTGAFVRLSNRENKPTPWQIATVIVIN
ncbi:hypothetical protein SCLCIDRAFT_261846 [Scleroderma citrinum Foug A]|uniref:Uncharacterized protein n=1 Tax=Scleroderma citrinum Foug A TaxID=1036808 RepID=A0A0C2ZZT6_9AGAM|nr:hypothetical protein SCLCIDRAFT_261846 [Scleroderma citrinum Foug A]